MQYKKKMILIVDDSYLIIERLTDMLKEIEHIGSIRYALSVADAADMLKETVPDVILLDINLPDGNGVELLRKVKEQYPAVMVVMLTNQVHDYYRQLCLKHGASHFVDKSRDFDLIPGIIASLEA